MKQVSSPSSIFTQIIEGKQPAKIIYRDDQVVAFHDKFPKAPIHVLIVPQLPIPNLTAIRLKDKALLGHLMWVVSHVASTLGLNDNGYRLIVNCNQHGGQEIQHLHLHLLGGEDLGPMRTPS